MINAAYLGVDGEVVLSVNGRPRFVESFENFDLSRFLDSTTRASEMTSGDCREYVPAMSDSEIEQLRQVVGTDGTWETWKMMGAKERELENEIAAFAPDR